MNQQKPALYFLGPQWFTPVMGWCGLALAWHQAAGHFGPMAQAIAQGCGTVAALSFGAALLAQLMRRLRHPQALAEDLAHPVRAGFAGALPVSMILLATVGVALGLPAGLMTPFWMTGLALQAAMTTWVLSRWMRGRIAWPSLTPVLYIPIVGNILVPLAGVPLEQPALSWAFFGVGAGLWPVITSLLLIRQAQQPLPDALAPAWFITVAPPSVAGASALVLGVGLSAAYAALGLATLMLLAVATRVPAILKLPFGMPFWAASFPLAAFSALMLRCRADTPALQLPAVLMLALSTLVILGLSLATLKGLRARSLLVPEPVTMLAVVPAGTPPATDIT